MIEWTRAENLTQIVVETAIVGFEDILRSDWSKDPQGNVFARVGEMDVKVNPLLSGLGNSWRPIMASGNAGDIDLLKSYLDSYRRHSRSESRIMLDSVHNMAEGSTKILRNKVIHEPGAKFVDIFALIKDKFPDASGVVYGTEGSAHRGEMQLLFGGGITIPDSPVVGDIVDSAVFMSLNGDVQVSYGINRRVCTNGLTARANLWQEGLGSTMRDDSLSTIRALVDWFSSLTTKRVENIRQLSVIFDKFPAGVVNKYWKTWSEKIDLGQLTFYEVVNDITSHANTRLSPLRQNCLNIRENFKKLESEHRCPTCSASVEHA